VGTIFSGDEGAGVSDGSKIVVGEGVLVKVEEGDGVVSGGATSSGIDIAANVVKVRMMPVNTSAIMIVFETFLVAIAYASPNTTIMYCILINTIV